MQRTRTRIGCILAAIILTWGLTASTVAAPKPFTHRMIYACIGFEKTWGIDTAIARMRAAASLGYNGFVVQNHEENYLQNVSQKYITHTKRAVAEAQKLNIALIPEHFYQGAGSFDNFNLAEAFPVRGTKFVVSGSKANAVQDHETGFKNGGFENGTTGWTLISMPGAGIETSKPKSGKACLRISGGGKYARIQQRIKLKPFRAYRLSGWFSTQGYTNWHDGRFTVEGTLPLLFKRTRPFGTPVDPIHKGVWTTLAASHGWRFCQTDFNSLSNTSAKLSFMVSDPRRTQAGTIWIDDIKLEEVGLYETVRTRTRPVTVKSADGKTTFKEGTDYVVDPKCNTFTMSSFHYQGHLAIPEGSAIKNGQELSVSWYQMSDVEQVYPETNFCISETRDALLDDVKRMDEMYEHNKWLFMGFDEWRTAFWDDQCELFPNAKTAGDYMAGTLRMSGNLLWGQNRCRELYVWNDMFDPYHNAYWPYYAMTNGGCQYSWKDMNENIIIINWNACGMPWVEKSIRFYMGLDSLSQKGKVYRQILSVMDAGRVGTWLNVVEKAEREGGTGVIGISYVDWSARYNQMAAIKNACVAAGRWSSGPIPEVTEEHCVDVEPIAIESPSPLANTPALSLTSLRQSDRQFKLKFQLPQNAKVSLDVVNLQGRRVTQLVNTEKEMGIHRITWDASSLPAGVYFVNLDLDGASHQTKRIIIL